MIEAALTTASVPATKRRLVRRCLQMLTLVAALGCAGDVSLRAQNKVTVTPGAQSLQRLAVPADRIQVLPLGSEDPLLFHSRLVEIDGKLTVGFRDIGLPARGWPIELRRQWSDGAPDTGLGPGWGWSFGVRTERDVDTNDWLVREAEGIETRYRSEGSGRHRAFAGRVGTNLQEVPGGIHRTWPDGAVEHFDAKGLLVARYGSDGTGYRLERSADGLNIFVTDDAGVRLALRFSSGRLIEATDTLRRSWRYEYAEGRLRAAIDALGRRTTFESENTGRLAAILSPDGSRISVERDVEGRVARLAGPGALSTTFTHRGSAGEQRFVQTRTDATGRATRLEMRRDDTDPDVAFLQVVFAGGEERVYRFAPGTIDTAANGSWIAGADLDAAGNLVAAFDDRGLRVELVPRVPKPGVGTHPDDRGLPRLLASEDGTPSWAEYDGAGRLIARFGASGGIERFTWDAGDRLTQWTDAAGGLHRLDWDNGDRMLRWVEPGGRVTIWQYDERGQVTAIARDGVGTLTRQYDPAGRLQAFHADDQLWRVSYDAAGRPLTIASDGGTLTLRWSEQGLLSGIVDAAGRDIDLSDGAIWSLADRLGHRRTLAATSDGELLASGPSGTMTVIAPLPDGDRRVERHAPGEQTSVERVDAAGNMVDAATSGPERLAIETDGNGRILRWGTPDAPNTYSYDDSGLLTERIGPTGLVTSFKHNAEGRLATVASPLGAAEITYDPAGRPNRVERDDGLIAERQYDDDGRITLTRETDAFGIVSENRLIWDSHGRLSAIESSDGTRRSMAYDEADRLVETVESRGPQTRRWSYVRDKLGRVVSATDPDGATTSITYDAASRPTKVTSQQREIAFAWDGDDMLASASVDGVAVETERGPLGGDIIEERVQAPDERGVIRVLVTRDRRGGTWTLGYGKSGLLVSAIDPLGGTVRIARDVTGRMLAMEDQGGRQRFVRYDDLSRPVASGIVDGWAIGTAYDGETPVGLSWSGGTVLETTIDRASRSLVARIGDDIVARHRFDERGRLIAVEGQGGSIRYEYDSADRVTAETDTLGRRLEYRYDAIGRLTELVLPEGDVIRYGYGATGQLETQTGPDGIQQTIRAGATVNDMTLTLGETSVVLESGVDRMLDKVAVTAGSDKRELIVERDPAGAVASLRRGQAVDRYANDALGRLVEANQDGRVHRYSYDASGNILSSGSDPQRSYDSAYRLTTAAGGTPVHDRDGRMLVDAQGRRFEWDRVGRLTGVVDASGTRVALRYDPLGRLIERVENGRVERYLHANDGIAAVYDGAGGRLALIERNALAPHLVRLHRGGKSVLLLPDQRGTPAFAVGANGIETLPRHDPWGGRPAGAPDYFRWIGFGGQVEEPAAGLVLYARRPYSPDLQRFLAPDPSGLLGGLNPYAFAANDPVSAREIDGLMATRVGVGPTGQVPNAQPNLGNLITNDRALAGTYLDTLQKVANSTPGPRGDVIRDTLKVLREGGTLNFEPAPPPGSRDYARTNSRGEITVYNSRIDDLRQKLLNQGVPPPQVQRAVGGILVHEARHIGHQTMPHLDRGVRELESNLTQLLVDHHGHAFGFGGAKSREQAVRNAAEHAIASQLNAHQPGAGYKPRLPGYQGLYQLDEKTVTAIARELTPDLPPSVLQAAVADAYEKGLQTRQQVFGTPAQRQAFQDHIDRLRAASRSPAAQAVPPVARAAAAPPPPRAPPHPPNGSKVTVASAPPAAGAAPGTRPPASTPPGTPRSPATTKVAPPAPAAAPPRQARAQPATRPPPPPRPSVTPSPSAAPSTARVQPAVAPAHAATARPAASKPTIEPPRLARPTPPPSSSVRRPDIDPSRRPTIEPPRATPDLPSSASPRRPDINVPRRPTIEPPRVAPSSSPTSPSGRRPNIDVPRNAAPPMTVTPRVRPTIEPPRVASRGEMVDAFAPAERPVAPPTRSPASRPAVPDATAPRPAAPDSTGPRPAVPDATAPRPAGPAAPAERTSSAFEGPRQPARSPNPAKSAVPVEPLRPPSLGGSDVPHRPPRVLPPDMPPAAVRPHGSVHLPPIGAVVGHVASSAFAALDIYGAVLDLDAYWSGRMGHAEYWSNQAMNVAAMVLPFPANAAIGAHMLGSALGGMAANALLDAARQGDPAAKAFLSWLQRSGFIAANDPTFVSIGQRPPPQLAAGPMTDASSTSPDESRVTPALSIGVDARLIATRQSWARTDRPDTLLAGSLPTGSTTAGVWRWHNADTDPAGIAPHQSSGESVSIHTVVFAAERFISTGERLVQYLWIDPQAPPQQIALQIYDEALSSAHRLYFGEDIAVFDEATGTGFVAGGAMPPRGRWLRLAIPAETLGLNGRRIKGLGFVTVGGRVLWGRTTMSGADDLAPLVTAADAKDTGGHGDVEILVAVQVEKAGRLIVSIEQSGGEEITLLDASVVAGRRVAFWQGPSTLALGGTVRVRQPDVPGKDASVPLGTSPGLVARIAYPPSGAIVRQTVPIFGEAGGPGFERYEVDMRPAGGGDADWRVVSRSQLPSAIVLAEVQARLADIMARNLRGTVYGNLASIQTGSRLHHFAFAPATEVMPEGGLEVRLRTFGRDGTIAEDRVNLTLGEVASSATKATIHSSDGMASLTVPPFALAHGLAAIGLRPTTINPPAGVPTPLSAAYQAEPGGLMLSASAELAIQASTDARALVALEPDGAWLTLPTRRKGSRLVASLDRIGESTVFYAADQKTLPQSVLPRSLEAPWPSAASPPGLLFASRPEPAGKLYAGPPIALADKPVLVLSHSASDWSSLSIVVRSGTEARLVPLGAQSPLGSTATIAPPLALRADGTRRAVWLPLAPFAPPGATTIDAIDLVSARALAWNTLGVQPAAASAAVIHSVSIGKHPPPGPIRDFAVAGAQIQIPSGEGWHWVAVAGVEWPILIDTVPPTITEPQPAAGMESPTLSVSAVIKDEVSAVNPATISVTVNGMALPAEGIRFDPASGRLQASIGPIAAALRLEDGATMDVAIAVADTVGNRSPAPLRWSWTWRAQPVVAGPLRQLTTSGAQDAAFTPDGGLVFVAVRDGRTDLFRSDGLGGPAERLTDDDAIESSPAPHPQGRGIAFERDGAVVWMRDGAETIVARGASDPAWWGADRLIASRGNTIIALNLEGTETVLCRAATGSTVRRPRPSQEGIVFTQAIYHESVWMCDPVSASVRPLSRDLDDPALREFDGAPGGSNTVMLLATAGRGGLWRIPLDGGERVPVLAGGAGVDRRPILAPDGSSIVFDSDRSGRRELWRLDLPATPRFSVRPTATGPSSSQTIVVSLATDAATNEASVSVLRSIDRVVLAQILAPTSLPAGNHQWRLPTTTLPSGEHIVEARLSGTSVRTSLRIDRDGPAITVIRSSDGRPLAPGRTLDNDEHLEITAKDPSGVASIEYGSANGSWITYERPLTVASLQGTQLKVRAKDSFGNVAEREVAIDGSKLTTPVTAVHPHGLSIGTILIGLAGLLLLGIGTSVALRMRP